MAVASAQSPRCLDDCLYRVRFGSLADTAAAICSVRFTPGSGHEDGGQRTPALRRCRGWGFYFVRLLSWRLFSHLLGRWSYRDHLTNNGGSGIVR